MAEDDAAMNGTLPDGRIVEYIDARWCGDEYGVEQRPGWLAVRVTYMLSGEVGSAVVYLSDEEIMAAFA